MELGQPRAGNCCEFFMFKQNYLHDKDSLNFRACFFHFLIRREAPSSLTTLWLRRPAERRLRILLSPMNQRARRWEASAVPGPHAASGPEPPRPPHVAAFPPLHASLALPDDDLGFTGYFDTSLDLSLFQTPPSSQAPLLLVLGMTAGRAVWDGESPWTKRHGDDVGGVFVIGTFSSEPEANQPTNPRTPGVRELRGREGGSKRGCGRRWRGARVTEAPAGTTVAAGAHGAGSGSSEAGPCGEGGACPRRRLRWLALSIHPPLELLLHQL